MTKLIAKLFLGILLGIPPALWVLQNDHRIKQCAIKTFISDLERKWGATITIDNAKINLFTGVIDLDNLTITSRQKTSCSWTAKKTTIHVDTKKLLSKKSLSNPTFTLAFTLKNNHIDTEYNDGDIGLFLLLGSIFAHQSPRFHPEAFYIKQGTISIVNHDARPALTFQGALDIKRDKKNKWHGRVRLENGSVLYNNHPVISKLRGLTQFDQQIKKNESHMDISVDHTFDGPDLPINNTINNHYRLDGTWKKNHKAFFLRNEPETLSLSVHPTATVLLCHAQLTKGLGRIPPLACSAQWDTVKNSITGQLKNTEQIKRSLLPLSMRQWLLGNKGDVTFSITSHDATQTTGRISFTNGNLHIPGYYNRIKKLSADVTFDRKVQKFYARNVIIEFYKGRVTSHQITIHLDPSGEILFAHADLHITNLLLNWKSDFFGIIDGNVLVTKQQPTRHGKKSIISVMGDIVLKKSLLKENIFFQGSSSLGGLPIFGFATDDHEVKLDLTISNAQDIVIKTPLLQTQASVDLHMRCNSQQNTLFTPLIGGTISLRKGTLTFPRHKLFISSGTIDFIPNQSSNPMVTLVAKNRIKKYVVTLQVAGHMQKPTVLLEADPMLTEEQVIALLFAGSENITLRSDLPAIMMQNLSTFILGNKQISPISTSFFQKIAQPLKYIQITPHFADQSGRGGVKGTISIDINKQLHAHIQKNFTMQDDLAFNVEYFLSDDCNVKAVKDHRGDIGGEIEFVFKP